MPKREKRGIHRKRRERAPLPGMMIHQDGSTHEWVAGQQWELIVTMDDATSEHYAMFFVEEEGTSSSFRGVQAVIEARVCSARSTVIEVAITGRHRKRTARSIKRIPPSSDAP